MLKKVVSWTQSLHFIPQGFIQTEKRLQFSPKREKMQVISELS